MLCVGGARLTEHSSRRGSETDLNYQCNFINQSRRKREGCREQGLLSPLRSLALSPIPHMEHQDNPHLQQYHSHTDLLLSNTDLYHPGLLAAAKTDSNPHRGGTNKGSKCKPSSKMTKDEDVHDSLSRRPSFNKRDMVIYGTIPRDNTRNVPKRTSSFQQLPRASAAIIRSQSCKLTSAEEPPYKTATRKYLYNDNCIQEQFCKPSNPPLKRRDPNMQEEGGKRNAFSVRTAIKRKLASLAGHSKENVRGSVSEMSGSYERLPILEYGERKEIWNGQHPQRMYQTCKGQLKLCVYMNYGLLTVHVMQGRHFSTRWKQSCDSYVKVSLVPDDTRRTHCKTETIYDTNSPNFDQKFSFELLDEDERKRLLVSVWHRDDLNRQSELLGCMSFGVHHIKTQRKVVNGWYYLLGEDVGRRKHMEVQGDNRQPLVEKNENRGTCARVKDSKNIPPVNKDVLWMDPHVIVIKRSRSGFGFSVTGTCPVQVCRVEDNSSAFAAGLQRGDCIVRINGQNVSRSSSDSVARLVRHASKKILLDIQRPKMLTHSTIDKSPWQPLSSTLLSESSDSDSDDDDHGAPLKIEDLCSLDDISASPIRNSMKIPKKKVTWGPNKWLHQMR